MASYYHGVLSACAPKSLIGSVSLRLRLAGALQQKVARLSNVFIGAGCERTHGGARIAQGFRQYRSLAFELVHERLELFARFLQDSRVDRFRINLLAAQLPTHFIEVGPGKVLSGLNRQILGRDAAIPTLNVEDPASLEKTLATLSGS